MYNFLNNFDFSFSITLTFVCFAEVEILNNFDFSQAILLEALKDKNVLYERTIHWSYAFAFFRAFDESKYDEADIVAMLFEGVEKSGLKALFQQEESLVICELVS